MRSFLLAATFMVAMGPAAFAEHADKDGPFAHANDNQVGTSTPYPGSPVISAWPEIKLHAIAGAGQGDMPTYAISQTHPDPTIARIGSEPLSDAQVEAEFNRYPALKP